MPDRALVEACTFMWSNERGLVPVYERLMLMSHHTDCIAELEELLSIQRDQIKDCNELLAALAVEVPGTFVTHNVPEGFDEAIPVVFIKESEILDKGYIMIDSLAEDGAARGIIERAARRQARQLALLREIARKRGIILVITQPPGPRPPAPQPGFIEYVIQPGDTLFLIAQRHGIPLEELIRANPQIRNPDVIFPGEQIRIPVGGQVRGHAMPTGARRYVVREGDTIMSIAQKFGISVSDLLAFNPQLANRTELTPGEVILIPAAGAVG